MKTTLVIMAAGIGSRFGGGIKQLAPVGPGGEIIMDYSIYDAIEAGFNKIVFVIRHSLLEDFEEVIGRRIKKVCADSDVEVAYAFQELDALPDGFSLPEDRMKPWGTGQAILACKGIVNEPFAVINADDYYGKESFRNIHAFLNDPAQIGDSSYCMAGFILGNTLSENGGVTRGVCSVDDRGYLSGICETKNIVKTAEGAEIRGEDSVRTLDTAVPVSMNMWGLPASFIDLLEKGFADFLAAGGLKDPKSEYLLPTIIGDLLSEGRITVRVLKTQDRWFGVTYKEDKASVTEAFQKLTQDGIYTKELF